MKTTWISGAVACGLLAFCGCGTSTVTNSAKSVGGGTKKVVTAPGRWYSGYRERKRIEDQSQLSTDKGKHVASADAKQDKEAQQTMVQEQAAEQSGEFQEAVTLVQQRNFRPALKILDKLLEEQPRNDQIFQWKGDCHYNLLELEQAIAAYKTARELNPNNHLALRGMGFACLHQGHQLLRKGDQRGAYDAYMESIATIRNVLRVWPADSEANFAKAMAIENATKFQADRAVSLLRIRDEQGADKTVKECLLLCNEGIEAAKFRINKHLEQPEPRVIVGNLFFRRAQLLAEFNHLPEALVDIGKAKATYTSIIQEIAPDHAFAQRQIEQCVEMQNQWQNQTSGK